MPCLCTCLEPVLIVVCYMFWDKFPCHSILCWNTWFMSPSCICTVSKKWLRFGFWFGFAKNRFSVRFRFYLINRGFGFGSVFWTVCCLMCMVLEMTYFRAELVQLIVSRSDSELEVQRYGKKKKYFDCWSYQAARWIVNETTWKTVPKPRKSVFWKPNCGNRVFGFWILRSVRFGF